MDSGGGSSFWGLIVESRRGEIHGIEDDAAKGEEENPRC